MFTDINWYLWGIGVVVWCGLGFGLSNIIADLEYLLKETKEFKHATNKSVIILLWPLTLLLAALDFDADE